MEENNLRLKGFHHAVASLLCVILAAVWILTLSDAVIGPLKLHWEKQGRPPWFEDDLFLGLSFTIAFVPFVALAVAALVFFRKFQKLNFGFAYEASLRRLADAKIALRSTLISFEEIEREYRNKVQIYERLESQLKTLQATKDMSVDELRQKLQAVALANSQRQWVERVVGFVFGILSSLAATYVWEQFLKR